MKTFESIAGIMLARLYQLYENEGQCLYEEGSILAEAMQKVTVEDYRQLKAGTPENNRYLFVTEKILQGDAAANSVLDIAIAIMLYPELGVSLKRLSLHEATVKNGWFAEGKAASYEELLATFQQCHKIFELNQKAFPFFDVSCYADNRLIGFLAGNNEVDTRISNCCTLFLNEEKMTIPFISREILEDVMQDMEQNEIIQIKGIQGCGKKNLIKYCANQICKHVVFVDFATLRTDSLQSELFQIRREAFFYQAYICLLHVTAQTIHDKKLSNNTICTDIIAYFSKAGIPVCICTEEDLDLVPHIEGYLSVYTLQNDSRRDNIKLWEKMSADYQIEVDAVSIGSRFRLNQEQVQFIFEQLKRYRQRNKKSSQLEIEDKKANTIIENSTDETKKKEEKKIAQLCRQMISRDVEKGELIEPDANMTLDRLVIPNKNKETIYQICNHIWYAQQVYQDWGMEKQYFYGKGVPVLFSGPPGTGKTMAAYVISNILDMPLYKVDLSQIVDKYIGETEKHLQKIFDFATHNSVILFFDEADSLFGKRSEVKEAKDRYANTEISYLLQRVEQYDGIVILATNLKNNIDAAFTRRMKYMINFNMPDESMRYQIWKNGFPEELPTEQIDFTYLAKQFELSGGNIKNILLAASFDAAGKHEKVGMKHILFAVRDEYMKYDKQMSENDFGEYFYLLK